MCRQAKLKTMPGAGGACWLFSRHRPLLLLPVPNAGPAPAAVEETSLARLGALYLPLLLSLTLNMRSQYSYPNTL